MGRKSRKRLQLKPFCYFCNREFDDEKVLIQHQKAKHFKCGQCNRKLETANGLAVHMQQVHKLIQRKVPCAMEGRDDVNSNVQGMYGIPFDIIEEYQMKHQKKIGDIDSRKQQRISWAVVSAAPTPAQFLAQLSIGNVYFPGFSAMPENFMPQAPRHPPMQPSYNPMAGQMPMYNQDPSHIPPPGRQMMGHVHAAPGNPQGVHGYQAPGYVREEQKGYRFSNGPVATGFQSQDDLGARTKGFGPSVSGGPLILGPKGIPIESSNVTAAPVAPRPVGIPTGGAMVGGGGGGGGLGISQAPRGFSSAPTNNLPQTGGFSDARGFSKPAGFGDARGFSIPKGFSSTGGFSDAPPSAGSSLGKKFERRDVSMSTQGKTVEATTPMEKQKVVQTQYYKTTGVAPLYIPPPALGGTKLAYDIDAVSIEERRAKLLYKWEDTV